MAFLLFSCSSTTTTKAAAAAAAAVNAHHPRVALMFYSRGLIPAPPRRLLSRPTKKENDGQRLAEAAIVWGSHPSAGAFTVAEKGPRAKGRRRPGLRWHR